MITADQNEKKDHGVLLVGMRLVLVVFGTFWKDIAM